MRRPLNAFCSFSSFLKHSAHLTTDDLCLDIDCWLYCMPQLYYGVSVIPSDVLVSSPERFATDAWLTACGVMCFGECFHREFPDFILGQRLHTNE